MKGGNMLCASQAATAIRLSMATEASPSPSLLSSSCSSTSSRAIDRHNPMIRDPVRRLDHPLLIHNHSHNHHQTFKASKTNSNNDDEKKKTKTKKSSKSEKAGEENNGFVRRRRSWSCSSRPSDYASPHGSSRYLLTTSADDDDSSLNVASADDSNKSLAPVVKMNAPATPFKTTSTTAQSHAFKPPPTTSQKQVVVLRVSLHCKGCEKKMRKHISKMQGVTSFNIDFVAKKVTVEGDVTPLEVLASVSKVKNAQLWTPPMPSTSKEEPSGSGETQRRR